jgi:Leucine-rich repeat (LRR) protein
VIKIVVNILFLSDIHFGVKPFNNNQETEATTTTINMRKKVLEVELFPKIQEFIENNPQWKIDCIAITGDLAWSGIWEEYLEFMKWLKKLIEILQLTPNDVIVCPGNHDLERNKIINDEISQTRTTIESMFKNKFEKMVIWFENYSRFQNEFGISNLNYNNQNSNVIGTIDKNYNEHDIRFVILNSAWFHFKDEVQGKLWLGCNFIDNMYATERLVEIDQIKNDKIIIGLIHHPFSWLNPLETDEHPSSMKSVKKLIVNGTHLILTGHTHLNESYKPSIIYNRSLHVVGGATYNGENYQNYFQILQINPINRKVKRAIFNYKSSKPGWDIGIEDETYNIFSLNQQNEDLKLKKKISSKIEQKIQKEILEMILNRKSTKKIIKLISKLNETEKFQFLVNLSQDFSNYSISQISRIFPFFESELIEFIKKSNMYNKIFKIIMENSLKGLKPDFKNRLRFLREFRWEDSNESVDKFISRMLNIDVSISSLVFSIYFQDKIIKKTSIKDGLSIYSSELEFIKEIESIIKAPIEIKTRFQANFSLFFTVKSKNISNLVIVNKKIPEIPNNISLLKTVEILKIKNCQIMELPQKIVELTQLKKINFSNNRLKSFHFFSSLFNNLIDLNINYNQLKEFPSEIKNCPNLLKLHLIDNKIKKIPNEISALGKIEVLEISKNQIENLNNIGNLKNLKKLYISQNHIQNIDIEIGNCQNLLVLDLSYNKIDNLPNSFSNLNNLKTLNISFNQFNQLPPVIEEIENLKKLIIDKNLFNNLDKNSEKIIEYLKKKGSKIEIEVENLSLFDRIPKLYRKLSSENDNNLMLLKKFGLPIFKNYYELSLFLKLDLFDLKKLCTKDNIDLYRIYRVKKKHGGFRPITVPNKILKIIQKKINSCILSKINAHQKCYSYKKGYSIVNNAQEHLNSLIIYKMDIENFFPSIKYGDVFNFFISIGYSSKISAILSILCTFDKVYSNFSDNQPVLPQGACTSPSLSNLIYWDMDEQIFSLCKKHNFRYSRYCDDLTFSSEYKSIFPDDLKNKIYNIIWDYDFIINRQKEEYQRKHNTKKVTGIIINKNSLSLPKIWVRSLRSSINHLKYDIYEEFELQQKLLEIEGKCQFAKMINKNKYLDLIKKFEFIKEQKLKIA